MSRSIAIDKTGELADLLRGDQSGEDTEVLSTSGSVVAVVLSPERYLQLHREALARVMTEIREANALLSPEEIDSLVSDAVNEYRHEAAHGSADDSGNR